MAAAASAPCAASEHRQFDFWVGEWEVKLASGKFAGRNKISSLYDGCVLHEQWTGEGGFTGTSLNVYDAERKVWHQTWADNQGGLLLLEGAWRDGSMRLEGTSRDAQKGIESRQRISWTPQSDGRVRQLWEASEDKGATWKVVFDGWYAKVK